eukprot:COSAG01_NODE_13747_length_1541_cov_2.948682_1_plen_259_part_00
MWRLFLSTNIDTQRPRPGSTPAQPTTITFVLSADGAADDDGGGGDNDDASAAAAIMRTGLSHAVEIDAYTLAVSVPSVSMASRQSFVAERGARTVLQAAPVAAVAEVAVTGGFSAVLLPGAACPGLLVLQPAVVPPLAMDGSNSTTLSLSLHAPRRQHPTAAAPAGTRLVMPRGISVTAARKLINMTAAPPVVTVSGGAGLQLSADTIDSRWHARLTLELPARLTLRATRGVLDYPAHLVLSIEGEHVLPTRRWVKAV